MATSNVIAPATVDLFANSVTLYRLNKPETAKDGSVKIAEKVTQYEKDAQELVADGWEITAEQVFTGYDVKTPAGIAQLVPDAEEQVRIFQRGVSSKFNQIVNSLLKRKDKDGNYTFKSTDEPFDTLELLQTKSERVQLNPLDRAMKGIVGSGLDAAGLAQLIAQLQGLSANQNTATEDAAE